MKEIKRYRFAVENAEEYMTEVNNGSFVMYEDHAAIVSALQEQVRALKERLQLVADLNDVASALHVEAENQVRALAAERDGSLKAIADIYMAVIGGRPGWSNWQAYLDDIVEEVSTNLREIRAQARAEGIHFAANRLLAAWESGFFDDTPAAAHDISGAILSAVEFLPNADETEFKRDYADEVRARIKAGEKS